MHLDDEAVRPGGYRRQTHALHHPRLAAGVGGVHHHRQVGELLHRQHGGEVQGVAGIGLKGADTPLAEDDPVVAPGHDVLGAHEPLLNGGGQAPLEQDGLGGLAKLLEQVEVLHVPGSHLNHVHAHLEHLHVVGGHDLGDDGQAGGLLCLLEQADAVVYDALAGDAVLGWIPEHTRKIDVGKRSGRHSKKQEEILEILLEEAKKGGTIVRLKGGDPFVFGRGGEEAEFLKKHQIPFEVVPGISSSLAVPAYFGIPVTHRGLAGSFHVITGHRMEGMPALDFEALARVGGTLIFLMSVANAPRICEGLLNAGMKPETPAAFLMNGTLASQRMIRATLQTLPEEGVRQGVKAPAILVIGEVCALADTCAWREEKPLAGKRIVITRPKERSQKLAEHLRDAGAEVLEFPTIELKPVWKKSEKADAGTADKEKLYELVRNLESYHWLVLTSPAGAQYLFELLNQMQKDFRSLSHLRFAVIGEGTASVCREHGIYPDYIPERFYAADLGKGLAKQVKQNERVCILRARHGSPELTQAFEAAGISYMDVTLYDTITPEESPLAERIRELLKEGAIDAVTFTSGSTVQGFLDILQPDKETLNGFTAVCIGEKTEKTASAAGMKAVLAESVSEEGIEQALYHM